MTDVPTPLLRDALRDTDHEPTPDCLDANALAAWFDGSLAANDRRAAERHVSSCRRCLSLLAAMARVDPVAPAAETRRWWRTFHLAWLTPLAAAAVAVVIWVSAPRMTIRESASPPTPPKASSVAREQEPRTTERTPPPPEPAPPVSQSDRARKNTSPPSAATAPQLADASARQVPVEPPAKAQVAPQPPPPSAPPAPAAARLERSTDSLNRDADVRAFAARPPALAESVGLVAAPLVVSKDGRIRWRVLGGGDVERSADAGRTWQRQPTGVTVALTTGSAPSADVCWLVGPAGTIVLTTDGRTWRRRPFTAAADLVRIDATDALTATVVAADGRSFVTRDGGQSWQPE